MIGLSAAHGQLIFLLLWVVGGAEDLADICICQPLHRDG